VHGFLKAKSLEKKVYSPEEKQSLIDSIENQSKRDVEKRLAEIQPKAIPKESKRVITPSLTEIKFVANDVFVKNLDRVREISAHSVPSGSIPELLERVVNEYLLRHDPKLKAEQKAKKAIKSERDANSEKEVNQSTSPATNHCVISAPSTGALSLKNKDSGSRYIPNEVKKMVWKKTNGECTFQYLDSKTNSTHLCGSKYGLEIEHILPFSLGGTHDLENLTLRCRTHNQLASKRFFGTNAMRRSKKM